MDSSHFANSLIPSEAISGLLPKNILIPSLASLDPLRQVDVQGRRRQHLLGGSVIRFLLGGGKGGKPPPPTATYVRAAIFHSLPLPPSSSSSREGKGRKKG